MRGHGGAVSAAEPDLFTFATGRQRRRGTLCIVGRAAPFPSPPAPGAASGPPLTGLSGARVGTEGEWPRPRLAAGPPPAPPFCSPWRGLWRGRTPSSSSASSSLWSLLPSFPDSLPLRDSSAVSGRPGPTAVFSEGACGRRARSAASGATALPTNWWPHRRAGTCAPSPRRSADWLGQERAGPAGRCTPGGAGRSLGSRVMGARPGREWAAPGTRRGAARFPQAWGASRNGPC